MELFIQGPMSFDEFHAGDVLEEVIGRGLRVSQMQSHLTQGAAGFTSICELSMTHGWSQRGPLLLLRSSWQSALPDTWPVSCWLGGAGTGGVDFCCCSGLGRAS